MNELATISLKEWRRIHDAVASVEHGDAKRIDGDGWKVYAAGTIVRIDIQVNHQEQ